MTAEELERFENVGRGLDELVRIAWQKRAFDIAFSVLLIVIFSPAIVLILLALAADGLLVRGTWAGPHTSTPLQYRSPKNIW